MNFRIQTGWSRRRRPAGIRPPKRFNRFTGVGALTALAFVLVLNDDPGRFRRSRDVGCYVGLRPKQQKSGMSSPQLGITKAGDPLLRRLATRSPVKFLGPFGRDSALRRWGLGLASRGGKNAKKRAVVAVAATGRSHAPALDHAGNVRPDARSDGQASRLKTRGAKGNQGRIDAGLRRLSPTGWSKQAAHRLQDRLADGSADSHKGTQPAPGPAAIAQCEWKPGREVQGSEIASNKRARRVNKERKRDRGLTTTSLLMEARGENHFSRTEVYEGGFRDRMVLDGETCAGRR